MAQIEGVIEKKEPWLEIAKRLEKVEKEIYEIRKLLLSKSQFFGKKLPNKVELIKKKKPVRRKRITPLFYMNIPLEELTGEGS